MHNQCEIVTKLRRREFLGRAGFNVGAIALSSMLARNLCADPVAATRKPLAPRRPHFAPRAKSVIFLNMVGAPPQLDMFDYKTKLKQLHNQIVPESLTKGERFAFINGDAKLLGPLFEFKQYGQAGMWMSSVVGHYMPEIADDICMIHGVHTEQFNHSPAALLLFTGFPRSGRPSMGAWVTYGLGNEAQDLPGFVVMATGRGGRCGVECYGPGFLPTVYQGVQFRSHGEPVLFLNNPSGIDSKLRRDALDTLRSLNQQEYDLLGDPEIQTRISAYEMAYRMQTSVPDLIDISSEPKHIHELYGTEPGQRRFGNNCLLARRLVERGVRFVQLNHGEWDAHGGSRVNIPQTIPRLCGETMQGAAALVKDLKQRGMLDDTLVIWGSEFGRTPMLQGKLGDQVGRDHHKAFTIWMAGGGVKRGFIHGGTDELGYKHLEGSLDVYDLQATVLHLLGLDHERLTYKFQGRQYRLTDVHGKVVRDILG